MRMYLLRLLIIALLVWIVLRAVQRFVARWKTQSPTRPTQVGNMVRCDHCGLHVPEQEALRVGKHYYCSEPHRIAAARHS